MRALVSESLRQLGTKACLQLRSLPLHRASEEAPDAAVLRVGDGSFLWGKRRMGGNWYMTKTRGLCIYRSLAQGREGREED